MRVIWFCDNDILYKTAALNLHAELRAIAGVPQAQIHVLPTAKFKCNRSRVIAWASRLEAGHDGRDSLSLGL